jgi:hypothetical protein
MATKLALWNTIRVSPFRCTSDIIVFPGGATVCARLCWTTLLFTNVKRPRHDNLYSSFVKISSVESPRDQNSVKRLYLGRFFREAR